MRSCLVRIGVDTGGTFTDVVAVDDLGQLRFAKLSSTPDDPAVAVLEGIARVAGAGPHRVTHGTTVATNALLTRSGGPTALVATRGFEDLLVLRRQARPKLYALEPRVPPPLIPDELRFGVDERLGKDGATLRPLDIATLELLAQELATLGVKSVAVALLHSYANGAHERLVGERLAKLGVPVSLSSEVLPEHREYERTATTVVDAYVAPRMAAYLGRLERALGSTLRVMRSSGGASSVSEARRHPVYTLLSGPAAGVIGARASANRAGITRFITLDMGGTSTDVALVDDDLELTRGESAEIDGLPIRVPSLAIHTVGAGGGSIARVDTGGALKVGPASAGALPGPACYRLGGAAATVTDAALIAGRIAADHFLAGAMRLDRVASEGAIDRLAATMNLSRSDAAAGVGRIATVVMARAVKVISVERGRDPRDFTLVAFGGAGGMYACEVAVELGMERVLVPPAPGLLCAFGALIADVARDYVATRITAAGASLDAASLRDEIAPLVARAHADLAGEGIPPIDRRIVARVDLRYVGQSYELPIDITAINAADATSPSRNLVLDFHAAHEARFGFSDRSRPVERVALRLHARGSTGAAPPLAPPHEPGDARLGEAIFRRACLAPGTTVDGPALIVELSATTVVAPGWRAIVDGDGALHLTRR